MGTVLLLGIPDEMPEKLISEGIERPSRIFGPGGGISNDWQFPDGALAVVAGSRGDPRREGCPRNRSRGVPACS